MADRLARGSRPNQFAVKEIVYALVNRQKHPRTSLFAGIALSIMFLTDLPSEILYAYMQYQVSAGLSAARYAELLNSVSACTFPFRVLGWSLLLVAIFGWKNVSEHQAVNGHAG